jgi:hypothetical protein
MLKTPSILVRIILPEDESGSSPGGIAKVRHNGGFKRSLGGGDGNRKTWSILFASKVPKTHFLLLYSTIAHFSMKC